MGALLAYEFVSRSTDCASFNFRGLSLVKMINLHGCSFLEDGAHLAASSIESNLYFSTGFVENALALHLLAMSSLIGWLSMCDFI